MKAQNFLCLMTFVFLLGSSLLTGFGQNTFNDSGTFQVWIEGRLVGTEEFSISQSGSGKSVVVIATGRILLQLSEGKIELTPRLRVDGISAEPVAYQVDISGDASQRIVATIGNGRVSAKIVTATGEQLREYVASTGAVVLERDVAHHYFFLASRTHSGRVPIIVPRENRQEIATVSWRGEEKVKIGEAEISLFHLVVQRPDVAGGGAVDIWVDNQNRVYKVEISRLSYRAERVKLPGK